MTDLTSILNCTYASSTLQLEAFEVRETAVVKEDVGRVYTDVTIDATLLLAVTTGPSDFAAKVAQALNSFRQDGLDFVVTGLGGNAIYQLLAARCMDGGPLIDVQMLDGDGPLQQRFKLAVHTKYLPESQQGNTPANSYKIRTAIRPDGLHTVTVTGDLIGPNAPSYYQSTTLPQIVAAYKNWILNHEYEASQDKNLARLSYTITLRETYGLLPSSGQTLAVDGDVTMSVETDEQHQQNTRVEFDLLVSGDPMLLVQYFQQQAAAAGQTIWKQAYSYSTISEQRLRGYILSVASGDHSPLLKWTESLSFSPAYTLYEEHNYIGADPVLVKKATYYPTMRQSGSATAIGKFLRAPAAFYSLTRTAPRIEFVDQDDAIKETRWEYDLYVSTAADGSPAANGYIPNPYAMLRASQDYSYMPVKKGIT